MLIMDGMNIVESMVICNYLEQKYPQPPLYPKDTLANIRVQEICEFINSSMQPMQSTRVMKKLRENEGDQREWLSFFMKKGLNAVSRRRESHPGRFTIGDTLTMADVFLYPQLYNARLYGIDLDNEYPSLHAVERVLDEIDAFKESRPEEQPDYKPEFPK